MSSENIHKGACFRGRGAIRGFRSTGALNEVLSSSESCSALVGRAGPVNAFTLWNPQSLKWVTQGVDRGIGTHNKTPIQLP